MPLRPTTSQRKTIAESVASCTASGVCNRAATAEFFMLRFTSYFRSQPSVRLIR